MGLLEAHHYRLPVLRFAMDLFDKRVMRRIVFEEEGDDDDDDDDDDDNDNDGQEQDGSEPEAEESTILA